MGLSADTASVSPYEDGAQFQRHWMRQCELCADPCSMKLPFWLKMTHFMQPPQSGILRTRLSL